MGVLSEIIIADRDEAPSINTALEDHRDRWECLESRGIDVVKLDGLSRLLIGSAPDHPLLDAASDHGPWICHIPDALVSAIAAILPTDEGAIAAKWADIEEMKADGWDSAGAAAYLHALVRHAGRARDTGKSLLHWLSL